MISHYSAGHLFIRKVPNHAFAPPPPISSPNVPELEQNPEQHRNYPCGSYTCTCAYTCICTCMHTNLSNRGYRWQWGKHKTIRKDVLQPNSTFTAHNERWTRIIIPRNSMTKKKQLYITCYIGYNMDTFTYPAYSWDNRPICVQYGFPFDVGMERS